MRVIFRKNATQAEKGKVISSLVRWGYGCHSGEGRVMHSLVVLPGPESGTELKPGQKKETESMPGVEGVE